MKKNKKYSKICTISFILLVLLLVLNVNNKVYGYDIGEYLNDISYNTLYNGNNLYCVARDQHLDGSGDTYFVAGFEGIHGKNNTYTFFDVSQGMNTCIEITRNTINTSFLKLMYAATVNNNNYKYKSYQSGGYITDRQYAVWGLFNEYQGTTWNKILYNVNPDINPIGDTGIYYNITNDQGLTPKEMDDYQCYSVFKSVGANSNAGDTDGSMRIKKEAGIYATVYQNGNNQQNAEIKDIGAEYKNGKISVKIKYSGIITSLYINDLDYSDKARLDTWPIGDGNKYKEFTIDEFYQEMNVVAFAASTCINLKMYSLLNKEMYIGGRNDNTKFGQNLISTEGSIGGYHYSTKFIFTGNLKVNKKSSNVTTDKLGGVKFVLRGNNGNYEFYTDSNGIAEIDNIPVGTYTLWEVSNPNLGYYDRFNVRLYDEIIINNIQIEVGKTNTVYYDNPILNKKYGSIQLTKKDNDTKDPIQGISFDILDVNKIDRVCPGFRNLVDNNNKTEYERKLTKLGEENNEGYNGAKADGYKTTNEGGIIQFSRLEIGTKYLVRETNIEEGKYGTYAKNLGKTWLFDMTDGSSVDWDQNNAINIGYGGIQINKKDYRTNNNIQGVGFKLYQGNSMIYRLEDTNSQGYTSSRSGTGNISSENDQGLKINTLYTIMPGTYDLYEYKVPSGYNLQEQGSGYDSNKGAYIGQVIIKNGEINNFYWTDPIKNKKTVSIYINKYVENQVGPTTIAKKSNLLQGAYFKLVDANNNVVKDIDGKNIIDYQTKATKESSHYGSNTYNLKIEKIPIEAEKREYYLYEYEKNNNLYDKGIILSIQKGYEANKNAVKIAKITIQNTGKVSVDLIEDSDYREYGIAPEQENREKIISMDIVNRKYINISGMAWEDMKQDNKINSTGNNKYESNIDKILKNVKVELKYNGIAYVETSETNSNGEYKFTRFNNKYIEAKDVKDGKYQIVFNFEKSKYVDNTEVKIATTLEQYKYEDKYLYRPVVPSFTEINGSKAISLYTTTDDLIMLKSKNSYYSAYTGYRK